MARSITFQAWDNNKTGYKIKVSTNIHSLNWFAEVFDVKIGSGIATVLIR